MKVINPNELKLLSTSIEETEAPVWSEATTYAKDAEVLFEHYLYKSLVADNVNKKPSDTFSGITASWQKMGASNSWKMFDETIASQSTVTGEGEVSITFSVNFKNSSSFALLNIKGVHLSASVIEEGQTEPYWSGEFPLLGPSEDWWEWFFDDQEFMKDFVAADIPQTKFGILTITLKGVDIVGIGHFIHGKQKFLGTTLNGMTPSLRSYSKKETNEFGDTRLIPRKSAKRFSGELYVLPRNADAVYNTLSQLENVLALWVGDDLDAANGGYQSLTVFGWIEEFHEALVDAYDVRVSITIQGLA